MVPRQPNLDPVRTRLQIQVLEHAVEVIHDPDVVAVGEHLGLVRGVGDPQPAIGPAGNRIEVAARRVTVRISAARAVEDADPDPGPIKPGPLQGQP